jgi:hypothetical protein
VKEGGHGRLALSDQTLSRWRDLPFVAFALAFGLPGLVVCPAQSSQSNSSNPTVLVKE